MIQSGGVLMKSSDRVVWEGPLSLFPGFDSLNLNGRYQAYGSIYRSQLWVSVLVNKRGNATARLPRKVYERKPDGGRADAAESPFGQLMAKPSKTLDPFLFWLWTCSIRDTYGEAFWGKIRDGAGRPIELMPLHPTKVLDSTDSNGKTTWQLSLSGKTIDIERRDLVHFRTFNPDTLMRGMSPLEPLRQTLENEDGARRANSALWRNGGRPSVVLEHPSTLSDAAVQRLSSSWTEIHSGVDNWAKAALLEEGLKANILPLNVEELQYIEARRLNREECCAAYDMPPPAVHILDRATFSNITEQFRSVYRDTMGPLLGAFESTVETELRDGRFGDTSKQPDFGDSYYMEFLLDEVLRGAFEERTSAYQQGIQAGWLMPSEAREKENLPFIAGSDQLLRNVALSPAPIDSDKMTTADLAFALQRMYLAVGVIITPDEARAILNRGGAGLTGSAPELVPSAQLALPPGETAKTPTARAVLSRLRHCKTLDDIDALAITAGFDADLTIAVLSELLGAQIKQEGLDGFKTRIRRMTEDS